MHIYKSCIFDYEHYLGSVIPNECDECVTVTFLRGIL